MIFVAYELNLPLNTENPHYRSQRAGEWSLIWAHDSRPIYRALTYIAVPLLGPHQPRYIWSTLYWVAPESSHVKIGFSNFLFLTYGFAYLRLSSVIQTGSSFIPTGSDVLSILTLLKKGVVLGSLLVEILTIYELL